MTELELPKGLEELFRSASRRWYQYGWHSASVLYRRLRSKYSPLFELKWAWQRVRRGYDDPALFGLNHALATLTVAGVRYMRETKHGYPGEFSPEFGGGGWEVWDDILARMEEGFQAWLDEDGWFTNNTIAEEKFHDAMDLYATWFSALWD